MAQLFNDQCRDAWNESRNWGLLILWLHTLPDLASTSILERIAALRERKTMTEKLANLFGFRVAPVSTFFRVFALVFLLVFIASVVITFILPETYASTTRIKVDSDVSAAGGETTAFDPYFIQTTFEVIQSEIILKPVIGKLNLNAEWGKKYFHGETLKTADTMEILKQRMQLAPVKNTKLIAITVYSDDKNEAAQIANAVAESYRDYRRSSREELADTSMFALKQQYAVQEAQIQTALADMNALQKKFEIPDDVEGLGITLASAEKSFHEKDAQVSQLRALTNAQKRNVLPTIMVDADLSDLLAKLQDAQQKYVTLTNDYALNNVAVTRVTSLMDVLNKQIDDRIDGIMTGLESQLAASKAALDELAAKVQKSKPTPETQQYWVTKHDLEQLTESHNLLYTKIQAQKLDAMLPEKSVVLIVDPAEPGHMPVRPNKTLNIALGGIAGVFLATTAGGAFALLSIVASKRMRKTVATV